MEKPSKPTLDSNLEGQLLIAMPGMPDRRFERSVIYMCAHSDEGAMGLIINQHAENMSLADLIDQIEFDDDAIDMQDPASRQLVHTGGPVESSRGFVLHSADYSCNDATMTITDGICLTATIDILRAMAAGGGPRQSIVALGYAGWAPGQLENELGANGWLHCTADPDLVFCNDTSGKYERALTKLGVNPSYLVSSVGHA